MTEFTNPSYDDHASGRAVIVGGKYYHRTHIVSYSQTGYCGIDSYASLDDATAAFERMLIEDRKGWGHNGARFSETRTVQANGDIRVAFRSVLQSGKPGAARGYRQLTAVGVPA